MAYVYKRTQTSCGAFTLYRQALPHWDVLVGSGDTERRIGRIENISGWNRGKLHEVRMGTWGSTTEPYHYAIVDSFTDAKAEVARYLADPAAVTHAPEQAE